MVVNHLGFDEGKTLIPNGDYGGQTTSNKVKRKTKRRWGAITCVHVFFPDLYCYLNKGTYLVQTPDFVKTRANHDKKVV